MQSVDLRIVVLPKLNITPAILLIILKMLIKCMVAVSFVSVASKAAAVAS